jgi:hypothetical protein
MRNLIFFSVHSIVRQLLNWYKVLPQHCPGTLQYGSNCSLYNMGGNLHIKCKLFADNSGVSSQQKRLLHYILLTHICVVKSAPPK